MTVPNEQRLVKKLASQTWRLNRCASPGNRMFALGERAELIRAADLYKTAEMKGLAYRPADDGFVLNNAEIEEYIGRGAFSTDVEQAFKRAYTR